MIDGTPPLLFFPDHPAPTEAMVDQVIDERFHVLRGGRLDPTEISAAVVFLAPDASRSTSGSGIDVSAGWSASFTA